MGSMSAAPSLMVYIKWLNEFALSERLAAKRRLGRESWKNGRIEGRNDPGLSLQRLLEILEGWHDLTFATQVWYFFHLSLLIIVVELHVKLWATFGSALIHRAGKLKGWDEST